MQFEGEQGPSDNTGCRKTAILSAEDLFRWRKKEILPVPQRGGVKDFEPDGSWLQDKRLETFLEEHLSVLAEPRVEKSGNLVKGTWDSEKKLVNIEKTAKFWMKMGFADSDRNWLHPEEALFLMEVNCLDLIHHGVSLSLQEAHSLLLHPSSSVSEEEYQVFAHLRRLGYIILRHAGKLDVTQYEMKIGLHNYSKKNKKRTTKSKDQHQSQAQGSRVDSTAATEQQQPEEEEENNKSCAGSTSESGQRISTSKTKNSKPTSGMCPIMTEESSSTLQFAEPSNCRKHDKQHKNNTGNEECEGQCECSEGESAVRKRRSKERGRDDAKCTRLAEGSRNGSLGCQRRSEETSRENETLPEDIQTTQTARKRPDSTENDSDRSIREPQKKKAKLDSDSANTNSALTSELDSPHHSNPWSEATKQSFSGPSHLQLTEWDFSALQFPDIGNKDTVVLAIPPSDCLPPNTSMDEEYEDVCMFDVEEYRRQQQPAYCLDQEDNKKHLRQLDFSYAEWYTKNFRPVAARNWKEWKEGFHQREKSFLLDSPVAHLWQGEVTPLVQPQHAQSTNALLKRLAVIQPYQGPFAAKEGQERIKISFDVYLPNTTFKKSSPGLPDHRVCVAKGAHPPDVFDVHAATDHLDDRVPLHWAVVSSGDISFFVFEDLDLPVHPSSLG